MSHCYPNLIFHCSYSHNLKRNLEDSIGRIGPGDKSESFDLREVTNNVTGFMYLKKKRVQSREVNVYPS